MMARFISVFLFVYVGSFVLLEWIEGLPTDPDTAVAVNIVILSVSIFAGLVAKEQTS